MFKEPDKHIPREWGQPNSSSSPWAIAVPLGIVAILFGLAFIPYGAEIGLALLGSAAAIALYRQGK